MAETGKSPQNGARRSENRRVSAWTAMREDVAAGVIAGLAVALIGWATGEVVDHATVGVAKTENGYSLEVGWEN
ncbi:hypothetical protein ACWEKR_29420 [Nocardia sp. NPDC004573]